MKATMYRMPKTSKMQCCPVEDYSGVRVALVDAVAEGRCILPQVNLVGVSSFNNFQYSEQGVTVWRAFEVGQGKLINQSQIEGKQNSHLGISQK